MSINRVSGTANGQKYVAVANIGAGLRVFVSTDSGLTFTERNPVAGAIFANCCYSPDGAVLYATRTSGGVSAGVIYRSTDDGLNWSIVLSAANFSISFLVCSNTRIYYTIPLENIARSILHSSTTIVSLANAGSSGARLAVSYNDERLVAAAVNGTNQVRVSSNQGGSFGVTTLPVIVACEAVQCNANGQRIILGGLSSSVARSTNGGITIFSVPIVNPSPSNATWRIANNN